jgi:hypothetical protein
VVNDSRHPVVWADVKEFGIELLPCSDVHILDVIRDAAFLQHNRDFPTIGRRPVVKVYHVDVSFPFWGTIQPFFGAAGIPFSIFSGN